MKMFTKEQAIAVRKHSDRLIGKPFDEEIKITNIWIIPIDQDYEMVVKKYQFENATSQHIAETYGNGKNLSIQVLSSDLLRTMRILPHADISQYLSEGEFSEILLPLEE